MKYDYDILDILSTLSKYANYKSDGLDSFKNPTYKVLWHKNVSEHDIKAYAKGMEEIYDIMFYDDCSMLCISKNVSNDIFEESLKEGISAFNKAIAKKYNETEPNGAGQYYLDWRFDLHDEKDNIEAIADKCGVTVEFQSDEGYFEVFEESKKSMKESKASSHEDNIEYGVERIKNKVKGAKVTYDFDDEDCFIDVTEKNGNLWAFTIDFGSGYVYMLEPKEDRGSFTTDNDAFDVIISMLQGKRFNE